MMTDAMTARLKPLQPGRTSLVAVLDIGSTKICCVIARLSPRAEGKSLRAVERGQGKVIEHRGSKVAAYRDPDGTLTVRSATCTHMGCLVAWNAGDGTWDCPCHGSRFSPEGAVISGPAESPLAEPES